jgi:methylated-DNA-[protein]-cysteine S-methyltransferase
VTGLRDPSHASAGDRVSLLVTPHSATHPSPLGDLLLLADDRGLLGLYLPDPRHAPPRGHRADAPFAAAREQLDAYFAGDLHRFDLPLAPAGTPFQMRVWEELTKIPFGETISYRELAERIGSPRAVRAVGLANGRNPLSIVVPCHRVIGADGTLVGYGGGLERKRWLLEHEAIASGRRLPVA